MKDAVNPIIRKLHLRFFDVAVTVTSDSRQFIESFGLVFQRLSVNAPHGHKSAGCLIECAVLTNGSNEWGKPVVVVDREVYPIHNLSILEGYACEKIITAAFIKVRSHLLVHAGVVSHHGRGILLVADAEHGKTTLTLELVKRGFKFLSDEVAALGRRDHRVYPFPRSLRIRSGTPKLLGYPEQLSEGSVWLDKYTLDVEAFKPNSIGEAAEISAIIILRSQAHNDGEMQRRSHGILRFLVDRVNDGFLSQARAIEGISEFHQENRGGLPAIRFVTPRPIHALARFEALCREHKIAVLDTIKGHRARPTFEAPARLEATPKTTAVFELMSHLQSGYTSEIVQQEFQGNANLLFQEFSAMVNHAECYQLFVGPLEQMADGICSLVAQGFSPDGRLQGTSR